MVNAWALAASILDGTFDEDYPIMDKSKGRWSDEDKQLDWIEKSGGFEWTPGSPCPPNV